MLKRKNYNWLYALAQFTGWIILTSLTLFVNYRANSLTANALIEIFGVIITGFMISHLFRTILIRKKITHRPIRHQIFFAFILLIFGSAVQSASQVIITYFFSVQNEIDKLNVSLYFVILINWGIIYLIWLLIYLLFQVVEKQRSKVIEELKLTALQNEIELNNLRSQLNPHFMFNSMNSIRALIDENPFSAKTAVTKLSTILRNSLLFSKRNLISLKEEIELVNDYLFLEKIRFEERLSFSISINDDVNDFLFPPLMLQTVVENAVKHGISKLPKGGEILISISKEDVNLFLKISNSGQLEKNENNTGIGLLNTKKRLRILYGEDAKFNIFQIDEKVICTIKIPPQSKITENQNNLY